jgi:hypothetical protein
MNGNVTILLPIIAAIVEFLKKIFPQLNGTLTIVASFVVGVAVALAKFPGMLWIQAVLIGLYAGGITAGLWSAAARVAEHVGNNAPKPTS